MEYSLRQVAKAMKAVQGLYGFLALVEYLKVTRVESWLGWVFSFSFGSIFWSLPFLERFLVVLSAFSFATASIFILNQYFDRKEDQENSFKSKMLIASGKIKPRAALAFSFLLIILCLVLVALVDVNLLSLFLVYLIFGTAYSAPPFRLKNIPVVDFVVSGIGAGFMPFLMGLELTHKLDFNTSSIVLGALPLMLIHCGGHIIQAVGDYEVDRKMGVQTSAVRFGRRRSTIIAGLMFLLACFLPFIYSASGFLSPTHLIISFILFPLSIPLIKHYIGVVKDPSSDNVIDLQKSATKYGLAGITLMLGYVLLLKIVSF